MNAWALPAAAVAFWAGVLAWQVRPTWIQPWMGMTLGLAALVGGWLAAPRRLADDALELAGLTPRPPAVVSAVGRPRTARGSPICSIALVLTGLLALGAGWAGVHAAWLDGSLLSRLAPRRVMVVGTLHTDPVAGTFGWHATFDITRVAWSGGAATLRASLWLSAEGDPPDWVRGDRGLRRRRDPPPGRSRRSPMRCAHKGMAVELNGDRRRAAGSLSEPVRPCGAGVPGVRRPVDRAARSRERRPGCCSGSRSATTRGWTPA